MSTLEELRRAADDPRAIRWFALEVREHGWNLELLRQQLEAVDGFKPEMMPKEIVTEYVGSPDVAVHICSAARSAELHHVQCYPVWEKLDIIPDEVLEVAQTFASSADSEAVEYFDWHVVYDEIDVSMVSGKGFRFIGATDVDDREAFDTLMEHERCNPSF